MTARSVRGRGPFKGGVRDSVRAYVSGGRIGRRRRPSGSWAGGCLAVSRQRRRSTRGRTSASMAGKRSGVFTARPQLGFRLAVRPVFRQAVVTNRTGRARGRPGPWMPISIRCAGGWCSRTTTCSCGRGWRASASASATRSWGRRATAGGLMDLVETELPDIAIVDIRMPPTQSTEGLKAAGVIRERYPSVGILVLSAFVEVEDALELLAGGAASAICSRAGSPSWTSSWRPSTASAGVVR